MKAWILALLGFSTVGWAEDCSLDYRHPQLRSEAVVDFCERFAGKPLLVVNTASRCGFTPQFAGLEALYQRYRERGLEIVGFPSDDFRQEYDDAEKTAKVCYVNYGVTFTMLESSSVRGEKANGFFAYLQDQGAKPPRWNFTKYLLDSEGRVVATFPSKTEPESSEMIEAIEKLL